MKLPKLKQGKWTVTVAYAGNGSYTTSTAEIDVKVKPKK